MGNLGQQALDEKTGELIMAPIIRRYRFISYCGRRHFMGLFNIEFFMTFCAGSK